MEPSRGQGFESRGHLRIAVLLLLTIQAVLLVHASRASFVTADEPGYFAAGVTAWRHAAFDLYRVNPPLARMLSVLPVLVLDEVREDHARWHPEIAGARGEREVGQDFAAANGARYLGLIRLARLTTIGWTLLGSWIVFAWARALLGARAGLLALGLWCFEPSVLAHGCLMTPDMPATVLGLAATWRFWHLLARPSWRRAVVAGALLGLALLAKFTNLSLLVVWPALALVAHRRAAAAQRPPVRVGQLAILGALALGVVNLGYGCQGTLRPLGTFAFTSDALAGELPRPAKPSQVVPTGNRFHGRWIGALPVPVPAEYLRGLDVQRRDFEHHFVSYLGGVWRDRGWWYYYLVALALKVPIGTLAIALAGLWQLVRGREVSSTAMLCVVVPPAFLVVLVSSQTGFNAHLRYLLPAFPFLAICAGRVARSRGRAAALAIALLVGWSVISTLRVYPDTLSYFNELAGGPASGDDYLLDSNLDWGQDALGLERWVAEHAPEVPLGLAYFGGADPRILGLRYTLPPRDVPGLTFATMDALRAIGPHPGLFAVSVNFLRGLPFEAPDGAGAWRGVGAQDFAYLRRFSPIATAGYSIRIYCIDAAQANAARAALGLLPVPPALPPAVDCATLRARSL